MPAETPTPSALRAVQLWRNPIPAHEGDWHFYVPWRKGKPDEVEGRWLPAADFDALLARLERAEGVERAAKAVLTRYESCAGAPRYIDVGCLENEVDALRAALAGAKGR